MSEVPWSQSYTLVGGLGKTTTRRSGVKTVPYRPWRPVDHPLSFERTSYPFELEYSDTRNLAANVMQRNLPPRVDSYLQGAIARVQTIARSKATEMLHAAQSDWGTTLVSDRKETYDMIERNARKVGRSLHFVRQGRGREAARSIDLDIALVIPRHWRGLASVVGGKWLEYWFGLAPLIGDLQAGLDSLVQDRLQKSTGYCGIPVFSRDVGDGYPWQSVNLIQGKVSCKVRVEVRLSNPNLLLASELGLTNPVKTLWNSLPFTWLLDWVGNYSQVMSSWDDLLGLDVLNASTSTKMVVDCLYMEQQGAGRVWPSSATSLNRSPGLPIASFFFTDPNFSSTRAATVASFLSKGFDRFRDTKDFGIRWSF